MSAGDRRSTPAPSKSTADDAKAGRASGEREAPGHRRALYAPKGHRRLPRPRPPRPKVIGKNGKPLSLRFVLPAGPGSKSLRTVGDRITRMLDAVGIRTRSPRSTTTATSRTTSRPATTTSPSTRGPPRAYPATDARPIYAKPVPAADGSLQVEQNYTRVGTDQIDQLFDRRPANWTRGPPVT